MIRIDVPTSLRPVGNVTFCNQVSMMFLDRVAARVTAAGLLGGVAAERSTVKRWRLGHAMHSFLSIALAAGDPPPRWFMRLPGVTTTAVLSNLGDPFATADPLAPIRGVGHDTRTPLRPGTNMAIVAGRHDGRLSLTLRIDTRCVSRDGATRLLDDMLATPAELLGVDDPSVLHVICAVMVNPEPLQPLEPTDRAWKSVSLGHTPPYHRHAGEVVFFKLPDSPAKRLRARRTRFVWPVPAHFAPILIGFAESLIRCCASLVRWQGGETGLTERRRCGSKRLHRDGEERTLRKDGGGTMRVIAEKSGSAIVSLRLAPIRRLQPLVPEPLVVQALLPGLALYAVGAFRYSELRVGHDEAAIRRWHNVIDATIMVPVRCPDRSVGWFVPRLYNTCPEVVAWAAVRRLPKVNADIHWSSNGRRMCVRFERPTASGERLEIHGRRHFGLPRWIWKLGPLRAVTRSTLLANDGSSIRRFTVGCRSIGRASYCSVSCAAEGIAMPAPWLSFGCVLEDFADFLIEAPQPD